MFVFYYTFIKSAKISLNGLDSKLIIESEVYALPGFIPYWCFNTNHNVSSSAVLRQQYRHYPVKSLAVQCSFIENIKYIQTQQGATKVQL